MTTHWGPEKTELLAYCQSVRSIAHSVIAFSIVVSHIDAASTVGSVKRTLQELDSSDRPRRRLAARRRYIVRMTMPSAMR